MEKWFYITEFVWNDEKGHKIQLEFTIVSSVETFHILSDARIKCEMILTRPFHSNTHTVNMKWTLK